MSVVTQKIYVDLTSSLLSDEDFMTLLDCGFIPDDKTWVWLEYANYRLRIKYYFGDGDWANDVNCFSTKEELIKCL